MGVKGDNVNVNEYNVKGAYSSKEYYKIKEA